MSSEQPCKSGNGLCFRPCILRSTVTNQAKAGGDSDDPTNPTQGGPVWDQEQWDNLMRNITAAATRPGEVCLNLQALLLVIEETTAQKLADGTLVSTLPVRAHADE